MNSEKVTERAEARLALLAERKKAKALKRRFRNDQRRYLRLKREKTMLTRAERAAYLESCAAFRQLCQELSDCSAVLRNARTSYEATLTKAQREALQYAKGWQDAKEHSRREQAELVQKEAR